jgi:oxygen-independent coproporphyrinogen III oxidase
MGYTPNYTRLLVGLGVSAISDTWSAFSQNIKTVEAYQLALQEDRLPLHKGHVLSLDDLMLRRFILNIMCHFEATWNATALENPVFRKGLERLSTMEYDGLVELYPYYFKVTEKGKTYLRNICMCFDERYWNAVREKNVFSSAI